MALEKVLQLRLTAEMKEKLEVIAEKDGRSVGDVVRRALVTYLAVEEKRDV